MKFGSIELGGKFGGITIINQPTDKLPQDLASALPDVLNTEDGTVYSPIWYYGTQLVNGMNHYVVVEEIKEDVSHICLAIINIPAGSIGGEGASLVELVRQADLYGELDQAFKERLHDLCGVGYKPIAYIGSQIVKGVNHFILCEGIVQYPHSRPFASVVNLNVFNGMYMLVSIERLGRNN